jgi:hypothetical protein
MLLVVLVALPILALAGPLRLYELTLTTPTNATQGVSATSTRIFGWLELVRIDWVTPNTGTVTIARDPAVSTLADETLLTRTDLATDLSQPAYQYVYDQDGAFNTNVMVRAAFAGESLRVAITNCTGLSATVRFEFIVEQSDKSANE